MSDRVLGVLGRGLVDAGAPVLRGDDLGLIRGDGVFETLRVHGGRAFLFDEHFDRMVRSAARMDLELGDRDRWRALTDEALAAYGAAAGVLRLYCTRGVEGETAPTEYLLVRPLPAAAVRERAEGVAAVTLSLGVPADVRRRAPWLLGGVKTTSYAVAMAAKREAERRGAQDAIWVSTDDQVLEGATSTVVVVSGDHAWTPPDDTGILPGTTLDCVRRLAGPLGIDIGTRATTVDELGRADEVLLLGSIRGVAAVRRLDGSPVGTGEVGPVAQTLGKALQTEITRSG
jgi:4-amino-4-deoxychorismate lyase